MSDPVLPTNIEFIDDLDSIKMEWSDVSNSNTLGVTYYIKYRKRLSSDWNYHFLNISAGHAQLDNFSAKGAYEIELVAANENGLTNSTGIQFVFVGKKCGWPQ